MNVSHYISEVTSHIAQTSPRAYPALVTSYYIRYLWNYEPDSWVARIAYFCRIVAFLVSLPTIILGLLDIASYGIARTLGVIDDVKASTSDKSTVHLVDNTPSILVEDVDSLASSDADSRESNESLIGVPRQPTEFFATDNNLSLSGVDVLSPAASRPGSPILTRKGQSTPLPVIEEQEPSDLRHRPRRDRTMGKS